MKKLRATVIAPLAAAVAACGDSPSHPTEQAVVTVRTQALPQNDSYVVEGAEIRRGCANRVTIANGGNRLVTLDSVIVSGPVRTQAFAATEYDTQLGSGEETTPTYAFYQVLANGTSTITVVFHDGSKRGTSAATVACAGKVSALNTGRTGALTLRRVAGTEASGTYRINNTTASAVEFAAMLITRPGGSPSWSGTQVGPFVAPGDSMTFQSIGADVQGVGYFVGDLFGSTPRS